MSMSNSVKCPRCQAFTAFQYARNQGGAFLHTVYGEYDEFNAGIIRCRACDKPFVVLGTEPVWPLSKKPAPFGVPAQVREAYEDAQIAHAARANIGALMAGRVTLERLMRDKEVSNYKGLADRQLITPILYEAADQIRRWANFVGHEDLDPGTLEHQEVEEILGYLGTVLEAVYTHPAQVAELARRTRELQKQSRSD